MTRDDASPHLPTLFLCSRFVDDEPYALALGRLLSGRFRIRTIDESTWTHLEWESTHAELRRTIREDHQSGCCLLVVLIGGGTWRMRRVDWEISAGIRVRSDEPHLGLLGLLLPSHPDFGRPSYDLARIPPRLYENVVATYARLADWTDDPDMLVDLIGDAKTRAVNEIPVNTFPHLTDDLYGDRWRRLPPAG